MQAYQLAHRLLCLVSLPQPDKKKDTIDESNKKLDLLVAAKHI
jgi:hypothetical protein